MGMRIRVGVLSILRRWAWALARALALLLGDALSPAACAACDAPVARRRVFCPACARTVVRAGDLPRVRPGRERGEGELAAIVAFGLFGGALATALKRLKYEGRSDLGGPLGHLLRRAAREVGMGAGVVVPVPLHPRRVAERGYNQAALLASAVADELRAPCSPRALARVRHTPQQVRLDRRERLRNVTSAFCVLRPEAVRGRRVVLVDDVVTTGATLEACAEALLRAGAGEVTALVVARAERDTSASSVGV